jgi:hypothetical protein
VYTATTLPTSCLHTLEIMRVYVATKEGIVCVDDLPQNATSRDLASRVLASKASDGVQASSEVARHYLVCGFAVAMAFTVLAAVFGHRCRVERWSTSAGVWTQASRGLIYSSKAWLCKL